MQDRVTLASSMSITGHNKAPAIPASPASRTVRDGSGKKPPPSPIVTEEGASGAGRRWSLRGFERRVGRRFRRVDGVLLDERLVHLDAGIQASVGATGDSYDNALAESVNALHKAELIHRRRWQTTTQVELATADWVAWWNTSRLHSACDSVPPAEFEAAYERKRTAAIVAA